MSSSAICVSVFWGDFRPYSPRRVRTFHNDRTGFRMYVQFGHVKTTIISALIKTGENILFACKSYKHNTHGGKKILFYTPVLTDLSRISGTAEPSASPAKDNYRMNRYKNKALNPEEMRRRREEEGIQLRKQKREQQVPRNGESGRGSGSFVVVFSPACALTLSCLPKALQEKKRRHSQ